MTMTDIILSVPYVSQLNIGGGPAHGGRHDPTGCWYASICMLGYYREAGPRLGVPEQYVKGNAWFLYWPPSRMGAAR